MAKCESVDCWQDPVVKGEWFVAPNSRQNRDVVYFCDQHDARKEPIRAGYLINTSPVVIVDLDDIERSLWDG